MEHVTHLAALHLAPYILYSMLASGKDRWTLIMKALGG